jgi:pyruvate formate lyase activating enzyme
MIFGGIQKNSLIDYPGKVSCVLFVAGCNFHCPYCHNPDLIRGEKNPDCDEETVLHFLENRRGFLDGVVISGGEPTLQEDLVPFCRGLKEMGYPVKLDTNGSRPGVVDNLIRDGLVDYIAMDVKTDPVCYSPLFTRDMEPELILESIRLIMDSRLRYEFRTTCARPLVDAGIIEKIGRIIRGAMTYALQNFQGTRVFRPGFFRGTESRYEKDDLLYLQSVAAPWVRECIVR